MRWTARSGIALVASLVAACGGEHAAASTDGAGTDASLDPVTSCVGVQAPRRCTSKPNGYCVGNGACEDWSKTGAHPCVTAADCPADALQYPDAKYLDSSRPNGGRAVTCDTGYCAEIGYLNVASCFVPTPCPANGACSNGVGGANAVCVTPL
jgi:hypothetical protein